MLDLTQQTLADRAGCARITLRRIEADALKPSKQLAQILLEKLGIPEPERPDWVLFARGLASFPEMSVPATALLEQLTNLPVSLTSFVGRESDVVHVRQRLARYRLVTLTGAGGIGKTRLAQQVASQLLDEYRHGVWFVELDSLNDPTLIPQTVATVFGIPSQSDNPIIDTLIQVLRAKTTLIILDNCEHLLGACGQLADKLLKNCPNLRILATSREPLGIIGEALYHVPSLKIPEIQRIESIEEFNNYEAVRLFDERAQLVQMDFMITRENASSVARICFRLDGIPLAIELAAARAQTFSAEQIASQLDKCFQILTTRSPTELPRHRSLQASIEWSWNLLYESEQVLLRRLSVFAGGFTVQVAEQVCAGNGIEFRQVASLLSQLSMKSLIAMHQASGHDRRYRLLETIRQYAHERLVEVGEEDHIGTQHLEYFLNFSEKAALALRGASQVEWFGHLMDERDNIRAALELADQSDVEAGLYIAGSLRIFWEDFTVPEGARWLRNFIENPESQAYPLARAKALIALGWLLHRLQQFDIAHAAALEGLKLSKTCNDQYVEIDALSLLAALVDMSASKDLLLEALSLAQVLKDRRRQAEIIGEMGWTDNDYSRRRANKKQAIEIFREVGDQRMLALYLANLAQVEMIYGDIESAQASLEEAIELNRYLKHQPLHGDLLGFDGRLAFFRGEYGRARVCLEKAATTAKELGNRMHYLWWSTHSAYVAVVEGNVAEARRIFVETVQGFQKDQSEIGVAYALEGMAGLFVAIDKHDTAARLIGWADATRKRIDDTRPLLEQADVDKSIAACLARMGDVAFSDAYEEGQAMSLDEAVRYALEEH